MEIQDDETEIPVFHVRLPGFISHESVGLGDAIKRLTYAVGVRPCDGCERRAQMLNHWVRISPVARRK